MEDLIEDFLKYLELEKKYSLNTIENYERDLRDYSNYLYNKKKKYNDIMYNDVTDYLIHLSGEKLKATSINRHLSSVRSFYNYLIKKKVISFSPFKSISGPKREQKLPNYLKYEEFLDLLEACDETDLGIRNRLILELLFATGLRVSELVSVKLKDIGFKEREIKIIGKGNKTRIVYFNLTTQKLISKYVTEARQNILNGRHNDYLIVNHLGNKITRRGIADILEKLIKKSSIKHKISPHTLRHTFATLLLNEGMDIREVQELLGHARLSTTSIYTHVSNEELRRVYLKSHPRAHKKP